jgi:hypothetical protein
MDKGKAKLAKESLTPKSNNINIFNWLWDGDYL